MRQQSIGYRRIFVKTPGGRNKIVYSIRKSKLARCGDTGKGLMGIPRINPFNLRRVNKSRKRTNRKYGGHLSSSASRKRIIEIARKWLK